MQSYIAVNATKCGGNIPLPSMYSGSQPLILSERIMLLHTSQHHNIKILQIIAASSIQPSTVKKHQMQTRTRQKLLLLIINNRLTVVEAFFICLTYPAAAGK